MCMHFFKRARKRNLAAIEGVKLIKLEVNVPFGPSLGKLN